MSKLNGVDLADCMQTAKFEGYHFEKAKFNTKIVSDMEHNGELVDVIGFTKGKDVYCDRYTVRFNDGTINDNIMSTELDFDYENKKSNERER